MSTRLESMKGIVKVESIRELDDCDKYQKVVRPGTEKGVVEVYIGQVDGYPITLSRAKPGSGDQSVFINKVRLVSPRTRGQLTNSCAVSQLVPGDVGYALFLAEYNKGVSS